MVSPTYGQYQTFTLENGRSYGVVDETRSDDQSVEHVSVRADFGKPKSEGNLGGAYYLQRRKDGTGGREIEVCGAHMEGGVKDVIDDIKQVAAQAPAK